MKRIIPILFTLVVISSSCVRNENKGPNRPKLVIGLVVDQMRWDYLYRYYERYGNDGFKRLMSKGYNCENTMINYLPTFTAPGHTCIYTGSVPAIHGIAGNDWIEKMSNKHVNCVDDSAVHIIGGAESEIGQVSPHNLTVSTITDELRLATNLRSRVYGIAIKDRSSVLPAGHMGNGAYWYDDRTGDFISSSYYAQALPQWLQDFNKRDVADSLVKQNWNLLYDLNTYTESTGDETKYEKGYSGEKAPVFPHVFDKMTKEEGYKTLKSIPAGNTITLNLAKACIEGEKLGQKGSTDFLCVSLSSTDYIGHQFGPNSVEIEDTYLRLDKELAQLLKYLDKAVGKGNYLFFISADHGAAHNHRFLTDKEIPAGGMDDYMKDSLNAYLNKTYGKSPLVANMINYQLYLNESLISEAKLDRDNVKSSIEEWYMQRPEVAYIVDLENIKKTSLPEPLRTMIINGYYRTRCGAMQVVLNPAWYEHGRPTGTTHGSWNPYDSHIPLIWYGWHVKKGKSYRNVDMTDITPTLAAMLHVQVPNGSIGKVIPELLMSGKD